MTNDKVNKKHTDPTSKILENWNKTRLITSSTKTHHPKTKGEERKLMLTHWCFCDVLVLNERTCLSSLKNLSDRLKYFGEARGRASSTWAVLWLGTFFLASGSLLGLDERGPKVSIYTSSGYGPFFLTGSVRVNRFLHYKTKNQTEPGFFINILIGFFSRFIGFFEHPYQVV
jgi:hypothetical protein